MQGIQIKRKRREPISYSQENAEQLKSQSSQGLKRQALPQVIQKNKSVLVVVILF